MRPIERVDVLYQPALDREIDQDERERDRDRVAAAPAMYRLDRDGLAGLVVNFVLGLAQGAEFIEKSGQIPLGVRVHANDVDHKSNTGKRFFLDFLPAEAHIG